MDSTSVPAILQFPFAVPRCGPNVSAALFHQTQQFSGSVPSSSPVLPFFLAVPSIHHRPTKRKTARYACSCSRKPASPLVRSAESAVFSRPAFLFIFQTFYSCISSPPHPLVSPQSYMYTFQPFNSHFAIGIRIRDRGPGILTRCNCNSVELQFFPREVRRMRTMAAEPESTVGTERRARKGGAEMCLDTCDQSMYRLNKRGRAVSRARDERARVRGKAAKRAGRTGEIDVTSAGKGRPEAYASIYPWIVRMPPMARMAISVSEAW